MDYYGRVGATIKNRLERGKSSIHKICQAQDTKIVQQKANKQTKDHQDARSNIRSRNDL